MPATATKITKAATTIAEYFIFATGKAPAAQRFDVNEAVVE